MSLITLKQDYELLRTLITKATEKNQHRFYFKGKYLLIEHAIEMYENYEKNIEWRRDD